MSTRLRILIVEDSESDAALIVRHLRKADYEVSQERVESAGQMRAALEEPHWDIVIADYRLPGFDAPAALAILQQTGLDLPFVVVSGHIGEETAVAMMKAGAHDYLMKNNLARLAPVVERELGEARMRRERRKAEEALRDSERMYRNLFETVQQGVVYQDADGAITSANPAAERILGLSADQMRGLKSVDPRWNAIHEDGSPFPGETHPTLVTLKTGKPVSNVVLGVFNPLKERRSWINIHAVPLFSAGKGKVDQVYTTFEDITERKQAEEELRKGVEDLARSNTELEQFAYVVSHDLQEPLRMVASYVQLLEERYKDQLDKDAHEFIAYAVDGATRMKMMITDLLAYSRVGRNGKEIVSVDCEAVLSLACINLRAAITEAAAEITHDPLPEAPGNVDQLTHLFQNLIGNAIKFRSQAPPQIHVSAVQNEKEWVFSVRDNGIGLDPQFADRIFMVFQRLHRREDYPGTGIGLAIARKIVEHRGGRIWVESEPGKGATFHFTVPVRPPDAKA